MKEKQAANLRPNVEQVETLEYSDNCLIAKRRHNFDKVCAEDGIKHQLTKFRKLVDEWAGGSI